MSVYFEALDWMFHPKSIAVIGASDRKPHIKDLFLNSQRNMGFQGPIYAVNAGGDPVSDYPTYKTISDIPGPVDHVILAVPAARVWEILQEVALKGVRSVTAFTSGFAESDDPAGHALQEKIRAWVQDQQFRFVGPNCMGLYCPETGLGFRPDLPSEQGAIGYVSQSGGMTITGIFMAAGKGLSFSKAVSYGNEIDVTSAELLRYLAHDPATEVVWAYIEGTRDGEDLLEAMRLVVRNKPLLVLKGGSTEGGGRAAASHTGAMAGASNIWRAAIRQTGAILVDNLEEMVDTTMALQWLPPGAGRRLCLACISGGLSVNYTDQSIQSGFEVPALSQSLVQDLRGLIDIPGTSLNNPLDLAAGFFQFQDYPTIFGTIDRSDEIDAMVMILALEYMQVHDSKAKYPDLHKLMRRLFTACRNEMSRPLIMVMPWVMAEEIRLEFEREFLKARFPTYPSMRRALIAMDNWSRYSSQRAPTDGT
ncbi:MAG: CoA-binding protein [Proteobacteria bacterium]|nr:CoA-binding protein [Pseudomonadota bacterium]